MSSENAFDAEVALAAAQLKRDQTAVNEALVQKIFQCEKAEAALRISEDKLHALLAYQHSHRENERRRIALEIHDTLGQNLLALRLDVASLHQHTQQRQPRLHGRAGAALDNLDSTISSIRQLIADLRPFQLDLGLHAALEWAIMQFERRHGVPCTVTGLAALEACAIDDAQLLTLYRALRECLDNIVHHARASAVGITLGVTGETLYMRIEDDGVGIDPAHPPTPAFGLMDMRERLLAAGGSFALTPAQPRGTAIDMTIPLYAQK